MSDGIFGRAVEAGGRLLVRSALNPILWLCAIIYIPTMVAFIIRPSIPVVFLWVGVAPVVICLLGFVYFMFKDPDKLQSEEFQIRKKTIEFSQQKGDPAPTLEDSGSVLTSPRPLVIGSGKERDE